ncbi:hypothetical protein CK203_008228 [Vitis vinifera]|uniref:Mitochondrial protein n=1 Tax=Vitis vinifera TaxID=29760 RepID=A0A438KNP8_VITVI|nr:hypothetical protein CK203_008228 [Vitis vinifera]
MTDTSIITNSGDPPSHTDSIITTLTSQMTKALSKVQVSTSTTENSTAPIGIKLDGSTYALWSQTLIGNFIRFPTTKLVWDAIDTTYFDGNDTSQVYELRRRVTRLQQGNGSLEKFYTELQGLWWEIDFRHPNPMERATDIYHYNKLLQEDHVYTFLDGLDDRLDNIRSDVLQMRPFPSIEQAYAHVRREALRQAVMSTSDPNNTSDMVMTTKELKLSSTNTNVVVSSHGKSTAASKQRKRRDSVVQMRTRAKCYNVIRTSHFLDSLDHMTFVATDFTTTSPSRRTSVVNANGVVSPITRDILTKEIIGCDTKRGICYYMEDTSQQNDIAKRSTAIFLKLHDLYYVNACTTLILLIYIFIKIKEPNWIHVLIVVSPRLRYALEGLSGETRDKEQKLLHFDWPTSETMVDEAPSLVSIDPTRLDGPTEQNITLENYMPSATEPSSPLPYDLNTYAGYTLPFRENRGKPTTRYSPDIEKRKSKYPIANYVFYQEIIQTPQAFVHVLSSSQISARVQEALSNPKWTQVIKEEMEALLKNNTWTIVPLPNLDWPLHQFAVKNAFYTKILRSVHGTSSGYTTFTETKECWECKPVDTPIVQNHRLGEYLDQAPMDTGRYQRLVGKLIYFSHTRPDIAYVVSVVSQFMHNPSEDHMDAVIRY